jgi:anaerobic selenocysteine-containing dehydrogenase
MGKAAPKVAVWMGPGAVMNPRGTYTAMAVHALNGLLGSIDVEGGTLQTSGGAARPSSRAATYVDELAKKRPPRARSSTAAATRTCRR